MTDDRRWRMDSILDADRGGLRGLLNHEGHEENVATEGTENSENISFLDTDSAVAQGYGGQVTQINTALKVLDLLCYQRKSKMGFLLRNINNVFGGPKK